MAIMNMNRHRLWLIVVVGAVSLFFGVAARSVISWYIEQGPVLVLEPESLDLGVISVDSHAKGYIELKNVGDRTLHVEAIDATCNCVRIEIANRNINPGETERLHVVIRQLRETTDSTQWLVLRTNQRDQPLVRAAIHFSARDSGIVLRPQHVNFGRVDRTQLPANVRVRISPDSDQVASDFQVSGEDDAVAIVSEVLQNMGESPSFLVTIPKTAPSGEFMDRFEFLDVDSEESRTLQVVGLVRGEFYAMPVCIVVSQAELTVSWRDAVKIHHRECAVESTINEIVVSSSLRSWLDVEWSHVDGIPAVRLRRRASNNSPIVFGRRIFGSIQFHVSSDGNSEVVNVPVELYSD